MKKKGSTSTSTSNSNGNGNNGGVSEIPKQKERHIVSWSQEEDDILREQIRIHGTENWTIIASKFLDKTTRQCRRRWYTYLNSDFKKGGWSPEEDLLLCEAQKIFGNRWTEIAKVVSGRTDNAVKNRFSTLCKKRAKHEALAKENNNSFINLNNKRVIFPSVINIDGVSETTASNKKMRMIHIPNLSENPDTGEKSLVEYGNMNQLLLRPPFAVLAQNFKDGAGNLLTMQQVENKNDTFIDVGDDRTHGTFLKKDDTRIVALMQQAELLSSLALKVNSENNTETAWKVLDDYLNENKEMGEPKFIKLYSNSVEELSSNQGSQPSLSLRQSDLQVSSPDSSEYSSGSTLVSHAEADYPVSEGVVCRNSDTEYSSPIQVTPIFRSLAAAVPTPNFSESERHFLLKTLGLESASPHPSGPPTQAPPCKRVLLHSL